MLRRKNLICRCIRIEDASPECPSEWQTKELNTDVKKFIRTCEQPTNNTKSLSNWNWSVWDAVESSFFQSCDLASAVREYFGFNPQMDCTRSMITRCDGCNQEFRQQTNVAIVGGDGRQMNQQIQEPGCPFVDTRLDSGTEKDGKKKTGVLFWAQIIFCCERGKKSGDRWTHTNTVENRNRLVSLWLNKMKS